MKRLATLYFRKTGYSSYFASKMLGMFYSDLKDKNTTVRQKLWAWRNGFFSDRIQKYNLNEDNIKNYLADLTYFKMHPINGGFTKWIDDKLTTKMILDSSDGRFMPEYYFVIKDNIFTSICEGKAKGLNGYNGLVELLIEKGELALKKLAGSAGKDFYKLQLKNSIYYINNKEASENSVKDLLATISVSIITEYAHAHEELKKFYEYSPNALRVMVIKDKHDFDIIASFIRIGSSRTGVVDNATAGGIFAGICLDSGKIYDAKTYNDNKEMVAIDKHPDTGIEIEGFVPEWDKVKEIVLKASEKMGVLCYMGFDVVVTPSGPKIIEINSHPTLIATQKYYPLGKNIRMQSLIKSKKAVCA